MTGNLGRGYRFGTPQDLLLGRKVMANLDRILKAENHLEHTEIHRVG